MAGITHFRDLNKKGSEFLNDLLNQKLIISEKVDGSSFSVKKEDGKLKFYNRNERKALDELDRSIISLYELPIRHLESIPLNKFKEGDMYSFEYFYNNKPVEIDYNYVPKNNLMLTNIKSNGTILTDPKTLNKKAKDLEVDGPFIIFDGVLNKKQKESIIEFVQTDFNELVEKFKTNSFTKYIISILNPSLKNTALRNGIESPIEGLVFKFNNNNKDFFAKLVDPIFTKNAQNKKASQNDLNESFESYKKTLFKLSDFISSYKIKNIKGRTPEIKKINAFAEMAIKFYNKNKNIEMPLKEQDDAFAVNTQFIQDEKLRDKINKDDKLKEIFRLIVSGFRKTKKRATKKFNKDDINRLNKVVNKINKLTEENINFNIIEESMTFKEYVKLEEYKKNNNALFLGRMQPPTKAHISIIENALKIFGKVYVAIVKGEKTDPLKNPFNFETQLEIINDIFGKNVILVQAKNGYVPMIIGYIEEKYNDEISAVLAGSDRKESYERQLSKNYPDVQVIEIPRTTKGISATALRNALRDDDYDMFKKNTDKRILKYFEKLKTQITGE